MTSTLQDLLLAALQDAHVAIVNKSMPIPNSPSLHDEKEAVVARFARHFGANFDALVGASAKQVDVLDYASLSLVEEDDLEAIIAMEGMIAHARNCDIPQYIKFTTRLDSLFFGTRIDESNNPMDPEQIGEAFKESMRPVGLPAKSLLVAYRNFNSGVFHKLETVLEEANEFLVKHGVLPDLDVAARDKSALLNKRSKQRQKDDPTDRAFRTPGEEVQRTGKQADLFPLVQKLLHRLDSEAASKNQGTPQVGAAGAGTASVPQQGMMIGSRRVEVVSNQQLLGYLSDLEIRLDQMAANAEGATPENFDLRAPLSEMLEEKSSGQTLRAVDAESADIIQLVTLLYDAIWRDETVPIPIKELIGRTQITILKTALQDPTFFDAESHPVRVLINELATAGIAWTHPDKLDLDPMYQQIKATIGDLTANFSGDLAHVERLIEQFREFKQNLQMQAEAAESPLHDADERTQRMGEIQEYAQRKINERVLDKELHPDVRRFLDDYFHKFLVLVIVREGPAGISWRPIMNTIDVLLWSVQRERQKGDLDRYRKIRRRLRTNLGKALEVAGIESEEAEAALESLRVVQEATFAANSEADAGGQTASSAVGGQLDPGAAGDVVADTVSDAEYLREVDQYPIGLWFEFSVGGQQTIRCTLAAKIETIEKFVFVNSQGVKVVEKSRLGLARELRAGTVKVICDGPLLDRAMEAVIAQLRDSPPAVQAVG